MAAESFDVLVSDIVLPGGTGIDLIRQIRQQYVQKIPALALTSFGMEGDIARCKQARFDDHLTKPVNIQRLEAMIQRVGVAAQHVECP